MNKKNIIIALLVVAFSMSFLSCDDFLEEKPYDIATFDKLGDSDRSAQMLVNGTLATINQGDYFRWGHYMKGMEFDSDYIGAGDWAMKGYGSGNPMHPDDVESIDAMWSGRYALIYRCNKSMRLIEEMKSLEPDEKRNYLGQMYFLRGWAYSQLVVFYGACPIYDKVAEDPAEYVRPRNSVQEVYALITHDLRKAEEYLFDMRDSKYQKGRISKYAAKTLLAQAYTYVASAAMPAGTNLVISGGQAIEWQGTTKVRLLPVEKNYKKPKVLPGYEFADPQEYYKMVKQICDSIVDFGGYSLYTNYMDTWKVSSRNDNKEFIWQLQASNALAELQNGISLGYGGAYSLDQKHWFRTPLFGMRDHWYELFEPEEDRVRQGVMHRWAYRLWTWGADANDPRIGFDEVIFYPQKDQQYVDNEQKGYQHLTGKGGVKYKEQYSGGFACLKKFQAVEDMSVNQNDYHYPFLRYPTVLLMLAEAENELQGTVGSSQKAKALVDQVRTRSHASAISARNMSQTDLRSFILAERARELALEGYRKWDLLRWDVFADVMTAIGIDEFNNQKRRVYPRCNLLPLPVAELNANSAIKQNPGW